MNIAFSNIIYNIVATIIFVVLTFLSKYFWRKYKDRNLYKFWSSFFGKSLTIVITEYPAKGTDRLSSIAKIAGNGWLISKGMALALSYLMNFFENSNRAKKDSLMICGDRTGNSTADNLIILGSPANNPYSRSMYQHLDKNFDLPYKMIWDDKGVNIGILISEMEQLLPKEEDGQGHDYALVIKAKYQDTPSKWVIIVAGCYMWGTEAASKAITNREIINDIAKNSDFHDNVTFIVKTRIVNDSSAGPELIINGKQFIKRIKTKKA